MSSVPNVFCFFFNDTATTEIYTLSLHDALPICFGDRACLCSSGTGAAGYHHRSERPIRSEEHTSELQAHVNLVCRLLLENHHHRSTYYPSRRQATPASVGWPRCDTESADHTAILRSSTPPAVSYIFPHLPYTRF